MKKFLFFISFFLINLVGTTSYCMSRDQGPGDLELKKGKDPIESATQERLFIENNSTAAVITYQYSSKDKTGNILHRVVYPGEIIWIDDPRDLISLKVSPHGQIKGWLLDPETVTFGKVQTEDYTAQTKGKISPQGAALLTIDPGYVFYDVKVEPYKSINIATILPLEKCRWLGSIFRRAGTAFNSKKVKRKKYYLSIF